MQITNPRYVQTGGYPILELDLDGRTARITLEQKPTLYQAGLIFLGADWEEAVPEIEFQGTTLRGFTNDPAILTLYDQFGEAVMSGTFRPGSI